MIKTLSNVSSNLTLADLYIAKTYYCRLIILYRHPLLTWMINDNHKVMIFRISLCNFTCLSLLSFFLSFYSSTVDLVIYWFWFVRFHFFSFFFPHSLIFTAKWQLFLYFTRIQYLHVNPSLGGSVRLLFFCTIPFLS